MRRLLPLALALALAPAAAAQTPWRSDLLGADADGRLVYGTTPEGHRLPDFSDAGYRGGEPLPTIPTRITVAPVDGDDTARIQTALDYVATLPLDAEEFRGAVELTAGTFDVDGTLRLRASGVVLRGAGMGADGGTVLRRTARRQAPVVLAGGNGFGVVAPVRGAADAAILDAVVPVGARTVRVDRPELFAEGDAVIVHHPATEAWLAAIGGGGTAGDAPWTSDEVPIRFARTVREIDGDRITLDAPVFARLDRALSPSRLVPRSRDGVVERVGVESLRITIETDGPEAETHAENALVFDGVEYAWARRVAAEHFWHAGVSVQESRYVTVEGCEALDPHSAVTGGRRYNFEAYRAQLVLFRGNRATRARHAYVANGTTTDSGVVFLDNVSEDALSDSGGHRRWGLGLLYDNHAETASAGPTSTARRLHLGSRGSYGTGHGWSCANCVAWNARMGASLLVVEKPPTAQNFAVGTDGRVSDRGPFTSATGPWIEGTGRAGLEPRSLFLGQRADRLGLPGTAAPPGPETPADVLAAPFPNPARGVATVEVAAAGPVRLTLHDALGRELRTLAEGRHAAPHAVAVDTRGLAPGVYWLRLAAADGVRTRALTVAR